MNLLQKLKEYLNRASLKYTNIKLQIRGYPRFVDRLLLGETRFARKIGQVGLICPDIELNLSAQLLANSSTLSVKYISAWFTEGSIIEVNNLERVMIKNVNGLNINFDRPMKITHDKDSSIKLFAVPVKSVFTQQKDSTILMLRTKHRIALGDIISFKTNVEGYYTDINIKSVTRLTDTDNEYPLTYKLELERGLPNELAVDELVYLRAYPAYFSTIIKVPADIKGPFLIDHLQGKIQRGKQTDIVMSATLFDDAYDPLTAKLFLIKPNYPVFQRSIGNDFMLFWNVSEGKFKITGNSIKCICDSEGRFFASIPLRPTIKEQIRWKINVKALNDTFMRIRLNPTFSREFNLTALLKTTIDLDSKLDEIESLEIAIKSIPYAEIEFGDWVVNTTVERFEIAMVIKENREAFWLGTGPIVKPFFFSRNDLNTQYDTEDTYDSGHLYL